jgi:hypothetical protein
MSQDSVVGMAMAKLDSQQGQEIFPYSTASRPNLGLTQPPIQWVPRALSPGVKRLVLEADHSIPSCAKVIKDRVVPPFPRTSS